MSFRPTTPITTGASNATQTGATRLSAVLRVGVNYGAKQVSFNPDNPKMSILNNCISVPWKLKNGTTAVYNRYDMHISAYAQDVSADVRLKDIGLGGFFDNATSPTQSEIVQNYADGEYRARSPPPKNAGICGIWEMDFVIESTFARYCLVRDFQTVEERLERAITHLNEHLSDEALARHAKLPKNIVEWRDFYIEQWKHALSELEKEESEDSESDEDLGATPYVAEVPPVDTLDPRPRTYQRTSCVAPMVNQLAF